MLKQEFSDFESLKNSDILFTCDFIGKIAHLSVSIVSMLEMNAHLNENLFFHNVLSKYARHKMKMHFGCGLVQICNFCDMVKLTITFSLSSTLTEFGGLCVSCFRCQETV